MTIYDAPDLTAAGIDFLIQDAGRLGLETDFLTGTVVQGNDPTSMEVICDGDSVPLTMYSTIGPLPSGAQVSVLNINNKGLFIIGSQVQALSAFAMPVGAGLGTGDIGGTGTSPVTGPGNSAPYETLILQDTFNRTVASGWGQAEVGPAWTAGGTTGSATSVAPGVATISMTASAGVNPKITQLTVGASNGSPNTFVFIRNHSRWVKNIQATVGVTAGVRASFRMETFNGGVSPNTRPVLNFYGDGTTTVFASPISGAPSSEIPISGVTAHQPVDLYCEWDQLEIRVWVELTSTGIDPFSAPLLTYPTGSPMTTGARLLLQLLSLAGEASSVTVGEVIIRTMAWPSWT